MNIADQIQQIEMKHDGEIFKLRYTLLDGRQLTVVGPLAGVSAEEAEGTDEIVAVTCNFEGFTVGEWDD